MKYLSMFLVFVSLMFSSCIHDTSADKKLASATEALMEELNSQLGMPNIVNFTQKKTLKMIYELCDKEGLLCYSYLFSEYTGRLTFLRKCVGYGIPFSAQYSNPETYKRMTPANWQGTTSWESMKMKMPQPEPNGLFMPASSSATWIIALDDENVPRVVYCEPVIVVSPFKLPCINPEDYPKKSKKK